MRFEQPASRDVRVILNENEAKVEAAQAQLEGLSADDAGFAKAWTNAARKYSQDQASKDRGGLLEDVVEGQGDPQLDEQVFSVGTGFPFRNRLGTIDISLSYALIGDEAKNGYQSRSLRLGVSITGLEPLVF